MHSFLRYVKLYTGCDDKVLKRLQPLLEKLITKPEVIVLERKVEVVRYHKFNVNPTQPISDFFIEYQKNNNITLEAIKKRCRSIETRTIRNQFIRSAVSNGYRITEVARFIGMDHTTIINVLKKSKV